eukprot:GEMP01007612.1.p1 GENE.GEMP01007612.1~~GEMP01007612.1.p1  ORF type:complete len:813 (+),score=165.32 GEMP01007612.1:339-2777(+)
MVHMDVHEQHEMELPGLLGSHQLERAPVSETLIMTPYESETDGSSPENYHVEHGKQPTYMLVVVAFAIGIVCGVVNFIMLVIIYGLQTLRKLGLQSLWHIDETSFNYASEVISACFVNTAIAVVFCLFAGALVIMLAPKSAGSGIPEIKGYLNGSKIKGLFGRHGLVRAVGASFVVASGMPWGREGPMVCTGAQIGVSMTDVLLKYYFRDDVQVKDSNGFASHRRILDYDVFEIIRKRGAALGAAGGVAAAFHAPIGGVLYIFEEVSMELGWSHSLTVAAVFVGVIAVTVSKSLITLFTATTGNVHLLTGLYGLNLIGNPPESHSEHGTGDVPAGRKAFGDNFSNLDLPLVIILGVICGALAQGFSKALIFINRKRVNWKQSKLMQAMEIGLVVGLVAFLMALYPSAFPCIPDKMAHEDGRHVVIYTCDKHTYNEAATLLLFGHESGITHFLGQDDEVIGYPALVVSLIFHFFASLAMSGLAIPKGLFIPNLYLGAGVGRIYGQLLRAGSIGHAAPGIYALYGMGAMLSGFTHMTFAIAVILMEATYDIENALPLVLAISVARLTSGVISSDNFDEQMLELKKVPILGPHLSRKLQTKDARFVMQPVELHHCFHSDATVREIKEGLKLDLPYYPVISADDNHLEGLISGGSLRAALKSLTSNSPLSRRIRAREALLMAGENGGSAPSSAGRFCMGGITLKANWDTDSYFRIKHPEDDDLRIPLVPLMNATPYSILPDMHISRFHRLFVELRLKCVAVTDSRGVPLGIIPRDVFYPSSEDIDATPHEHKHELNHGPLAGFREQVGHTRHFSGS